MCAMITSWESRAINDEMVSTVETMHLPRMKYAGALEFYDIHTSKYLQWLFPFGWIKRQQIGLWKQSEVYFPRQLRPLTQNGICPKRYGYCLIRANLLRIISRQIYYIIPAFTNANC